ncbi:hypothetical protein ACFFNY_01575 [Paenibacillus hodogayensis]|uniref:S1 motif domain-containing protein n=1 Tax=Paenibacillus hodogayensis TaxID=279208 RepID=A0ABV5VPS2_9BACL
MRYLKSNRQSRMSIWHFEIDADGTAFRQIATLEDGSCITSNRKHEPYHFMLSEHPLDPAETYYEDISQAEFEALWYEQLQVSMEHWHRTQSLFPVGVRVEGFIEAFFPQGTLINLLEPLAVGITDTFALEAVTPSEWMCPRYRVIAMVSGYDEVNQWVLLANAEVLGSRYEYMNSESRVGEYR